METIPVLYLLYVLLGCLLAIIAIWSRKRLSVRTAAVLGLIVLLLLNYAALFNLLGRPQPLRSFASTAIQEDSVVLAASIEEGVSIYLWLRHPRERQPRYYIMDWSHDAAMTLKRAMEQSLRNQSTVMMSQNYERSLEDDRTPLFYALPHQRLPLKPPPDIFEYRNPNNTI